MKFLNYLWLAVVMAVLIPVMAFGQSDVVMAAEPSITEIFALVMAAIGDWKAVGWQAGLAGMLTVMLSTMKNSLLRKWLWDKVPEWGKVLIAPLMAMAIFGLVMPEWNAKVFMAALTTGAAAVYLHQLFDGLKEAPWIKPWMKPVIDFFAKLLKKPEPKA